MRCRFRPIVLPGGRSAGSPARPRLTRSSLRVVQGRGTELERALDEAVAAARRIRDAEQRRARLPERAPDDVH